MARSVVTCMATKKAKATRSFDKKFGEKFIRSLPVTPGVYFIHDPAGTLIYIGKAKNLRRRLGQYRNARRRKKHAKMRAIVAEADRIEYQTCDSDLAALLLETRLIQEHRPKWNVAGAFHFLYPLIGLRFAEGVFHLCYTTEPELFPEFRFHGSYRSRLLTRAAFFGMVELFAYVGHLVKRRGRAPVKKYSYTYAFRQLPENWEFAWSAFLRGESRAAAEDLVLSLVENAGARNAAGEIQEHLNALKRFWRHESLPLQRARTSTGFAEFPVPQRERDLIFLRYKEKTRMPPGDKKAVGAILEQH